MGSRAVRNSRVPTEVEAKRGVKTKYERGDTTAWYLFAWSKYDDIFSIYPNPLTCLGTKEKARARTPEREQRVYLGVSVLQGLILGAVSTKYRSAGRTTTRDLILDGSTPKNRSIYQFAMKPKALFSWAQALNFIDLIGRLLSITRVPKLTC